MKKLWSIICVLFGMIFIAGCSDMNYYGTGNVEDKNFLPQGYRSVEWSNENQWLPECFELVIRDSTTKKLHKGCVSERVWNDAMLDHQITITEDYS